MIPPTMLDGLEPVMTSSGFAITRRGRSGDVAVTGAGGEERCGSRAFGDADAVPCAPHCTRIVSHYQNVGAGPPFAHGDAPKPHRYADTVAKSPIGRPCRLVLHVTRRAVEWDAAALPANNCTGIITRDIIEFASATESAIWRFNEV